MRDDNRRMSPRLSGHSNVISVLDDGPMLSGALYDSMSLDQLIGQMDECEQRLFACDCAERVLPIYESRHPADILPRAALETARRYAEGTASITDVERALHSLYEAKNFNEFHAFELFPEDAVHEIAWKSAVRAILAAWFPDIRARSTTIASGRAVDMTIEHIWQRRRAIWYLTDNRHPC